MHYDLCVALLLHPLLSLTHWIFGSLMLPYKSSSLEQIMFAVHAAGVSNLRTLGAKPRQTLETLRPQGAGPRSGPKEVSMKIRKASASDTEEVKALWAYCFEKPSDPFFQWYFQELYTPETVLLGEEKGQAACDLHRRPYRMSVRGQAFDTDYIVGVATHPAARGRGYASELLRSAFHLAAKEGKPFVTLMPSAASYYLPMGFGFFVHQWERKASPEHLAPLGKKPVSCRVLAGCGEWQELASVYEAYTKDRNGFTLRDEASWKSHIEGQLKDGYIALVYDEKGPSGYLFYSLDDGRMIVTEMAFANESGRKGLYSFMAGHRGSIDECIWYEPLDDHSFRYWEDGAEHTYIKNRSFPYMLARLTDPVTAFDGLPCREDITGAVAFQLVDSFLPENSGIYVLRAEDGKISALKEDVFYSLKCHIEDISGVRLGEDIPEPSFCINAGSLAELFMGAAGLSELEKLEKIRWLTEDAKERADVLALTDTMLPEEKNWVNEWF